MEEVMNFSDALELVKRGKRLRRTWWAADVWIELARAPDYDNVPYIYKLGQWHSAAWTPKRNDLFARDWVICDEQKEQTERKEETMDFEMHVKMGSFVRDVVTGFEGIVTSYTKHLTGCDHVGLKPRKLDKDGKEMDVMWIDVTRAEVLEEPSAAMLAVIDGKLTSTTKKQETHKGGPADNPPERIS